MFAFKVIDKNYSTAHKSLYERLRRLREEINTQADKAFTPYKAIWEVLQATPSYLQSEYERQEELRIYRIISDIQHEVETTYHEASQVIVQAIISLEAVGSHYVMPMPGHEVDEAFAQNGVFYMEEHHNNPLEALPIHAKVDVAKMTATEMRERMREVQAKVFRYGEQGRNDLTDALAYFMGGMHQPVHSDDLAQHGMAIFEIGKDGTPRPVPVEDFFKPKK